MNPAVRIQKYLSEQGIASRRQAEAWINDGYIKLNGELVTEPGVKFIPGKDKLEIDERVKKQKKYYYLYHKPRGIVTVNAQVGEKEIKDLIQLPQGVVPVGRLDKDSSGLIILTNDGVVARRLMEPSFEHEKEYLVRLDRPFGEEALREMRSGLYLFGEKTKPMTLKRLGPDRLSMILREGKNRQIRRLWLQVGFTVKELSRVRIVNLELDKLLTGQYRALREAEIKQLYKALKLNIY